MSVRQLRIEDDVGKQGFDDRLAAAFEKRLAGGAVGSISGCRMLFAADPVDDGANVAVDQGESFVSQSSALKLPLPFIGSIEMTRLPIAVRAAVSIGASSEDGSRVTSGPR